MGQTWIDGECLANTWATQTGTASHRSQIRASFTSIMVRTDGWLSSAVTGTTSEERGTLPIVSRPAYRYFISWAIPPMVSQATESSASPKSRSPILPWWGCALLLMFWVRWRWVGWIMIVVMIAWEPATTVRTVRRIITWWAGCCAWVSVATR